MIARCAALLAAMSLLVQPAASQAPHVRPNGPLPAALHTLLATEVKLTAGEMGTLASGAPVSKMLDADPSREVALFGGTWIDATPADYVNAVKDIERFEHGDGFLITKRISDPPRLEDFDRLDLPESDIADLKTCRVGDCELKLAESALDRARREIDWSKPSAASDVEALARRLALEYVAAYQHGGNGELAVYRDAARPTFVAREFESLIARTPSLNHVPELRAYLLDYPRATLASSTSFFYWHKVKFGLKPTVRINHVVIQERPDVVLIAIKQLYASHYFWTALQLQALVPDRSDGRGFWLINVSRSRSDGLGGFVGRLIRSKVTSEAQRGMAAALAAAKATLEGRAR